MANVRDLGHFSFWSTEFFEAKGLKPAPIIGCSEEFEIPEERVIDQRIEALKVVNHIQALVGREFVTFTIVGTDWVMLVEKDWEVPAEWFDEVIEGPDGQIMLHYSA